MSECRCFIEFARMCGHLIRQCKCGAEEKPVRFRGGLCGDCAYEISVNTTRHHFPKAAVELDPSRVRPRLHIDEYRRQAEVRKVQQSQIPLFDAAQEVEPVR